MGGTSSANPGASAGESDEHAVSEITRNFDSAGDQPSSPHLHDIWNELTSLKRLVENDHDRKLRRIETDLRWTMMLVGAQFITIIGSAIATLVG
ncbi:hypothetical protein FIL92_00465 [SAR202 cluster bacterium AD-812-D07_MRT_10900m]|jgi:hypothetical protein|nr:hypothetical protein [SAR202 cluster bacterium AD-812-D07_MRT_10900m]